MIYTDVLKRIIKVCTGAESRYVLRGVYVDAEKQSIVATDGHALAALSGSSLIEAGEKSFFVPLAAMKAAQVLFAEEEKRKEIRKRKDIFIRASEDCVTVSVDGSKRAVIFEKETGKFPRWDEVLKPPAKFQHAITISASLLTNLVQALNGAYNGEDAATLYVVGPESPVYVTTSGLRGKSVGVLMPMRIKTELPAVFWKPQEQAAD